MSFRNVIPKMLGIDSVCVRSVLSKHHDPDVGDYTFDSGSGLWRAVSKLEIVEIVVAGRSSTPTDEQKQLLKLFLPKIQSLTKTAKFLLSALDVNSFQVVPDHLVLREIRFESAGITNLIFDPEIELDGYSICPMAICSSKAEVLSVEWIV